MTKEELWNRLHGKVTGHNAILLAVSLIFMGVCVWDVLHSLYWQALIAVIISNGAIILDLTVFYVEDK